MAKETKFCSNCGAEIDKEAEICPKYGMRVKVPTVGANSPGLAAVLSFFDCGFGSDIQRTNWQGNRACNLLCHFDFVVFCSDWVYFTADSLDIRDLRLQLRSMLEK